MKAAKEAVDKCVSALKKELDAAAEENKDTTGQTIGVAAGMGPKAPKKDAAKKATAAKAGGKEPAKPDLSKKGGDGDKKNDKKDDKKEPKKEDSDKKLQKEEKAEDKKDKADAKKGKEQKGTAQITAKVVAKA